MKARSVKPGAIVKDGAGNWQVVVRVDTASTSAVILDYASGRQEQAGLGSDVEIVGLTIARVAALRAVSDGGIHRYWTPKKLWQWKARSGWQPLRAEPYNFLVGHGLIGMAEKRPAGSLAMREDYQLTVSGRALLAIFDGKEVQR